MANMKTELLIQGKAAGFTDVQRQLQATNEKLERANKLNIKTTQDLAKALGMAGQQAKTVSKAFDGMGGGGSGGGGQSFSGTVSMDGMSGGTKRKGPAGLGGEINGILRAIKKASSSDVKQRINELSGLFAKLRTEAHGAAEAIHKVAAAGGEIPGTRKRGGGGDGGDGVSGSGGGGGGGGRRRKGHGGFGGGYSGGGGGYGASMAGAGYNGNKSRRDPKSQHVGAFRQGFLEGAMPGDLSRIIDRGPGATRQALGLMSGNMAKSVAGVPFNGAAGLSQAIGSIPFVGGALGGLMSRSFSQVGTALSADRQEQSLAPYLGASGLRPRAARGATNSPFAMAGRQLAGLDFTGAQSFAGQMARASGQSLDHMGNQGMYRTALAASTAYGIGSDVSGQFVRMGLQGNRNAGGTTGEAGLRRVMGQAQSIGLSGQDLQNFVSRAGAGAATFDQTGYAPNQNDIGSYAQSFKGMGMGGVRASNSAAGFGAALQNLGQNGPQDGLELLIEQQIGGYQGGGIDDSADANRRLRNGFANTKQGRQQAGSAANNLFRSVYQASGGGKLGHETALKAFQRVGIAVNDSDIDELEKHVNDPNYAGSTAFQDMSQKGLAAKARGIPSDITKGQADLENQANDLGHLSAAIVQSIEKSTNNMASRVGEVVVPYLKTISETLEKATNPKHAAWDTAKSAGSAVAHGLLEGLSFAAAAH